MKVKQVQPNWKIQMNHPGLFSPCKSQDAGERLDLPRLVIIHPQSADQQPMAVIDLSCSFPPGPDSLAGPLPMSGPVSESGTALDTAVSDRAVVEPPEQRPWGWFELLAEGPGYRVKRLHLDPHQRLSRQRHQHRLEHWLVVQGQGSVELGDAPLSRTQPLEPGSSLMIPPLTIHRAAAGSEGLEIIEVQRGPLLREDDIERFADDYGRV